MNLRDHMQTIYDQHGKLTPEVVMQEARPKGHPLHDRIFDRPKGEAAEAWYRHRAHELIQSCRIVYREANETEPELSVRAFHAVPSTGPDQLVYEPTARVVGDRFTRRLVLNAMERDWRQLFARYEQFEEFLALVSKDVKRKRKAA